MEQSTNGSAAPVLERPASLAASSTIHTEAVTLDHGPPDSPGEGPPLRRLPWGDVATVVGFLAVVGLLLAAGIVRSQSVLESDLVIPWWALSAIGLVPLFGATIGKAAWSRHPGAANIRLRSSLRRSAMRNAKVFGRWQRRQARAESHATALSAYTSGITTSPIEGAAFRVPPLPPDDRVGNLIQGLTGSQADGLGTRAGPVGTPRVGDVESPPTGIDRRPEADPGAAEDTRTPRATETKAWNTIGYALGGRAAHPRWAARSRESAAADLPRASVATALVRQDVKGLERLGELPVESFKTLMSPLAWSLAMVVFFLGESGIGADLGFRLVGVDLANVQTITAYNLIVPAFMGASLGVATFFAAMAMGDTIARWLGPVGRHPRTRDAAHEGEQKP